MLETAAAVVVGASVILFDPIFQGLAISLLAGSGFDAVVAPGRAGSVLHGGKAQTTGAGQRLGAGALSGGLRMAIERGLRLMAGVFVLLSLARGYLGQSLLVFR